MDEPTRLEPYDRSERDFLHDLANPLAIVYGHLRMLAVKMQDGANPPPPNEILEKINKAIRSFDKANNLIEMRRMHLKNSDAT